MKEQINNPVVKDITTKKKYVKPDFEVVELKMEAPLLTGSATGLGTTINGPTNGGSLDY